MATEGAAEAIPHYLQSDSDARTRTLARMQSVGTDPPRPPAAYVIQLREQADLARVATMPRTPDRRDAAWRALTDVAQRTQPQVTSVLDALRSDGVVKSWDSIPLANALAVTVDRAGTARFEARMRQVDAIGLLQRDVADWSDVPPNAGLGVRELARAPATLPKPWAIERVGAPTAWAAGMTGAGVRLGVVDSGANVAHPALRTAFERSHPDHRWRDLVHGDPSPHDASDHGSGSAGVAVGGSPGRAIGVAPGASLIVAKGGGYEDEPSPIYARLQALDWMLAPGDPERGVVRDARRGADIVSSSWGVPGDFAPVFDVALRNLNAAGVVTVFSAGNSGPDRSSVELPGASAHAITVGASSERDEVDWYSGRGPVSGPGGVSVRKPDLVAPGSMPSAAGSGTGYVPYGMTSGAAPMAAGAAAILLQRFPQLTPEQVRVALTRGAVDIAAPGVDDDSGHGRLDIPRALAAAGELVAESV